MKSKNVADLIKWLNDITSIVDMPRDFTVSEAKRLIDIAENEILNIEVADKIKDFKKNWYVDCKIKSKKAEYTLNKMVEKNRPFNDILLSESQLIDLVEIAENEIIY